MQSDTHSLRPPMEAVSGGKAHAKEGQQCSHQLGVRSENGPDFIATAVQDCGDRSWRRRLTSRRLARGRTAIVEPSTAACPMSCLIAKCSTALPTRKSSSRHGDDITIASGHTAHLAIAHPQWGRLLTFTVSRDLQTFIFDSILY